MTEDDGIVWQGVVYRRGALLRYLRNPYPAKGHPDAFAPWIVGALYRVTDTNPMGGRYTPLVAFAGVDPAKDGDEYEVGADTVALGFEIVAEAEAGRA